MARPPHHAPVAVCLSHRRGIHRQARYPHWRPVGHHGSARQHELHRTRGVSRTRPPPPPRLYLRHATLAPDVDRISIEIAPDAAGCTMTYMEEGLRPRDREATEEGWNKLFDALDAALRSPHVFRTGAGLVLAHASFLSLLNERTQDTGSASMMVGNGLRFWSSASPARTREVSTWDSVTSRGVRPCSC